MILIGVVFTGDPRMQQVFRGNYGKAVRRGGGVPVFLPWKPKHAAFWAKHLDGFLFTGGGDPDPDTTASPCARNAARQPRRETNLSWRC